MSDAPTLVDHPHPASRRQWLSADAKSIETIARWTVMVIIVLSAAQAVWGVRGLYADGSYYFWNNLQTGDYFTTYNRVVAMIVTQAPLVLAENLGVGNISILARLQSFGTAAIPMFVWVAALLVLRRQRLFWLFVMMFAVAFLNSGFVSVGEYNFAESIVVLSAALLLRRGPLIRGSRTALLALAALLLFSYESVVFLAPVLGVFVVNRLRAEKADDAPRGWNYFSLVATLILYGFSTVIAGANILFPRDASNAGGASNILSPLQIDHPFLMALLSAVVFTLAWLLREGVTQRVLSGLVIATSLVALVLTHWWMMPWMQYSNRAICGALILPMLVGAFVGEWLSRRRADPVEMASGSVDLAVWLAPAAMFVAMIVPFTQRTQGFAHWVRAVDTIVSQPGKPEAPQDVPISAVDMFVYGWTYTNPYLSQDLHAGNGETVLLSPGDSSATPPAIPAPIPSKFGTGPLFK